MQHTCGAALGAERAAVAAPRRAAASAPCRAAPRRGAALRVRAAVDGDVDDAPLQLRRRDALSLAAASAAAALSPAAPAPAFAAGRGKAKSLPDEAYSALPVRNPGGGCAAGVARNGSAPRQP
jgi:hypothetical protein